MKKNQSVLMKFFMKFYEINFMKLMIIGHVIFSAAGSDFVNPTSRQADTNGISHLMLSISLQFSH